jgi:hypothetical protein
MLRRRRTLALGLGLLVALDVLGLPHSGKPRRGRRASSLKRPCLPATAPGNQAHGP